MRLVATRRRHGEPHDAVVGVDALAVLASEERARGRDNRAGRFHELLVAGLAFEDSKPFGGWAVGMARSGARARARMSSFMMSPAFERPVGRKYHAPFDRAQRRVARRVWRAGRPRALVPSEAAPGLCPSITRH